MNDQIKCNDCGKFVSHKDIGNGDAIYKVEIVYYSPPCEGADAFSFSLCKKCLNKEENAHLKEKL